jgi:hypothetical protein
MAQIDDIARSLSVGIPGADIFVFYSGQYLSGASAHDAAASLAAQSSRVAIIDNTPLGRFLNHPDLIDAVVQLHAGDQIAANSALFEGQSSLWGQASLRFATDATGQAIVLTGPGGYNPGGIWGQVEFPALLYNPNITSINGEPSALLRAEAARLVDLGLSQFDEATIARSIVDGRAQVNLLGVPAGDVVVNVDGTGDVRFGPDFLSRNGITNHTGFDFFRDIGVTTDSNQRALFSGFDWTILRNVTLSGIVGAVTPPALDFADMFLTAAEASQYAAEGDYVNWGRTILGWAGGTIGGVVGAGLATTQEGDPVSMFAGAVLGGQIGQRLAHWVFDLAVDIFDLGGVTYSEFVPSAPEMFVLTDDGYVLMDGNDHMVQRWLPDGAGGVRVDLFNGMGGLAFQLGVTAGGQITMAQQLSSGDTVFLRLDSLMQVTVVSSNPVTDWASRTRFLGSNGEITTEQILARIGTSTTNHFGPTAIGVALADPDNEQLTMVFPGIVVANSANLSIFRGAEDQITGAELRYADGSQINAFFGSQPIAEATGMPALWSMSAEDLARLWYGTDLTNAQSLTIEWESGMLPVPASASLLNTDGSHVEVEIPMPGVTVEWRRTEYSPNDQLLSDEIFIHNSNVGAEIGAALVSRSRATDDDGEPIGPWRTEVRRYDPSAPEPDDLTAAQIGEIFGAQLGSLIAGSNPFTQVLAGSALATVLGNIGGTISYFNSDDDGGDDPDSLSDEVDDVAVPEFSNFFTVLKGQATGAVSSFLAAELGEALGLEGFGRAAVHHGDEPQHRCGPQHGGHEYLHATAELERRHLRRVRCRQAHHQHRVRHRLACGRLPRAPDCRHRHAGRGHRRQPRQKCRVQAEGALHRCDRLAGVG